MSEAIVKVQVPMPKSLRDAVARVAAERGFDSIQAYFRFVATNDAAGRTVTFSEAEPWPEPPREVLAAWERDVEEAKTQERRGELPAFTDVDDAMRYLNEQ
ncbi:MAG: hypothetical protein ACM3MA_01935 [Acidobacteriota bacterium]